jgi:tRNA pseudouridine synthase B
MNGFILVNKKKGMTSRDVVNFLIKILNTKKIGHTGTLDPFAEGLLLVAVNKGLKVIKLLNYKDKEYVAKVRLGIKTDTLDITGNVLEKSKEIVTKKEIEDVLKSFIGEYSYEVPIYSAIKVNGKKLYEYAREGKKVEIPIKDSYIYDIKLINIEENSFTFSVKVSNGTYIRALVRDISKKLNKIMTLEELTRTKIDSLLLKDAYTLEDIKNNNFKLLKINDLLNYKEVELSGYLEPKVLNGNKIKLNEKEDNIVFIKDTKEIAVYTREECDIFKVLAMINDN